MGSFLENNNYNKMDQETFEKGFLFESSRNIYHEYGVLHIEPCLYTHISIGLHWPNTQHSDMHKSQENFSEVSQLS